MTSTEPKSKHQDEKAPRSDLSEALKSSWEITGTERRGIESYILRNSRNGAEAEVLASLGAAVHRLSLATDSQVVEVLQSEPDAELLSSPWFRGKLMIPFANRIPGGSYSFQGRDFQLSCNNEAENCAMHGFLADRSWRCVSANTSSEAAELILHTTIEPDDYPGYPFTLSVVSCCRLTEAGFELELEFTNMGADAAPLSFGWHPYFHIPDFDRATIEMAADNFVEVDKDLIPNGSLVDVSGSHYDLRCPRRLSELKGIDLAFERFSDAALKINTGDYSIVLDSDLKPFRFTQLFIPSQHDSIAVEPLSAAANAFNLPGLGLISLAPGETVSGTIHISVADNK